MSHLTGSDERKKKKKKKKTKRKKRLATVSTDRRLHGKAEHECTHG